MKKNIIFFYKIAVACGLIKSLEIFIKRFFARRNYRFTVAGKKIDLRKKSTDLEVFVGIYGKNNYRSKSLNKLRPEVIVDIGCNNGVSLVAFKADYPNSRIIGIEPDPGNYAQAILNVQGLENVEVINEAVWHSNGSLELKDNGKGDFAFSFVTKGKTIAVVNTVTIDSLMKRMNINNIDLLKIDIEGGEYDLFKFGNNEWLSKVKCIVIELHNWIHPDSSEIFIKSLYPYKFQLEKQGECFTVFFDHSK
jgi:FkbM family methyltransferase